MKSKINKTNIIFLIIIILLIIPKTRVALQVFMHKGLSFVNQSSLIEESERKTVSYDNWLLMSEDNEVLNFTEIQGKVVLVNFWATWCPPCIAEMPSFQKLYHDYKDKVVFLFVTNEDFDRVAKFKENKGYNFKIYNPLKESPKTLKTSIIPRTFIINKKGEIVVNESGAVNWNSDKVRNQLDQLLSE